jgi:uncharacterized protein
MKLHAARPSGRNMFSGYGDGYVLVNAEKFERSVIVLPDRPVSPWGVSSIENLTQEDITALAALGVEILLLGTGKSQRFPHPRVLQSLREARVGVEVMDSPAACRTYNILLGEERNVAAAIIV